VNQPCIPGINLTWSYNLPFSTMLDLFTNILFRNCIIMYDIGINLEFSLHLNSFQFCCCINLGSPEK
jgi:hypothetical protein